MKSYFLYNHYFFYFPPIFSQFFINFFYSFIFFNKIIFFIIIFAIIFAQIFVSSYIIFNTLYFSFIIKYWDMSNQQLLAFLFSYIFSMFLGFFMPFRYLSRLTHHSSWLYLYFFKIFISLLVFLDIIGVIQSYVLYSPIHFKVPIKIIKLLVSTFLYNLFLIFWSVFNSVNKLLVVIKINFLAFNLYRLLVFLKYFLNLFIYIIIYPKFKFSFVYTILD